MTVGVKSDGHDVALYQALLKLAFTEPTDLREGQMFGAPAIYVGRRMAACVLGGEVGLRVPAGVAAYARNNGRARAFTPYGKSPMREWIALDLSPDQLSDASDLIAAAIAFARTDHAM